MLLPNLERALGDLFDFYKQPQTIEAFFKASKHLFGMANLRSRRFLAIAIFLGLVLLTHNLLVWTKAAIAGCRKCLRGRLPDAWCSTPITGCCS